MNCVMGSLPPQPLNSSIAELQYLFQILECFGVVDIDEEKQVVGLGCGIQGSDAQSRIKKLNRVE